jgi:hydrogenase maturation protease
MTSRDEVRVLVACVGNLLRRDDGFGVVVARTLADTRLPDGTVVIETGIGGLGIVHELMNGYDGLVVVDAVDMGASPGSLVVIEPLVEDPAGMSGDAWHTTFSNFHLAEPGRVLLLARGLGVLPPRVALVGCQPGDAESYGEELTPAVAGVVPNAAACVVELVEGFARDIESLVTRPTARSA